MEANIKDLIGKTIVKIEGAKQGSDCITFQTADCETFFQLHRQYCCESVTVEDVIGDIDDLIGAPILTAEERQSGENPPGVVKEFQDSFTWTFYMLATRKGFVSIRWYGESNGYYSESVDFCKQ